jgi:pimeloyl-ACP methyl ester carboxylesterase
MPKITASDGVDIFYKDWGSGQPIVFSHGWPLSSDDWDNTNRSVFYRDLPSGPFYGFNDALVYDAAGRAVDVR